MAKRKRKSSAKVVPPTCNCLLICDDVLTSLGKQKHLLQGVIGLIVVRELPAVIGGYIAYVRLSNVHGEQKIALTFSNASTNEELFRFEAQILHENDPLGVYTLIVPVPNFVITESGRYIFSALHNEVPFAQSPILVQLLPQPEEK